MAKQGQHNHDNDDKDVSKEHNNPTKSTEINTGTEKKQDSYRQEAAAHKGNNAAAQHQSNTSDNDTHDRPDSSEAVRPTRNGSDSNES